MPDDDAQGTETTSHDPSSLDTTEDPTASLDDLPEDAEGYMSSTEAADEGGARRPREDRGGATLNSGTTPDHAAVPRPAALRR